MDENSLLTAARAILGPIDHRTSVEAIRARISEIGEFASRRLMDSVGRSALVPAPEDEQSRVVVARLLVSLVPASLPALQTTLGEPRPSDNAAELHFSIFVALSDLPELVADMDTLRAVTEIVTSYLRGVATDQGQAAWMAGDLLGDHWPAALALPALQDIARNGLYAAGREGAIHGLSHALGRVTKPEQWNIMQTLKDVAATDGDSLVRQSAEMAMSMLRA